VIPKRLPGAAFLRRYSWRHWLAAGLVLWLGVRLLQSIAEAESRPRSLDDAFAATAGLFAQALADDAIAVARLPLRLYSVAVGLATDPAHEGPALMRWFIHGKEALICRPRHVTPDGEETEPAGTARAQYEHLREEIVFQTDVAQGGNIAGLIYRAFREGGYPVVFLPQHSDQTRDVRIVRVDNLRHQRCDDQLLVRYNAVEYFRLKDDRFDGFRR